MGLVLIQMKSKQTGVDDLAGAGRRRVEVHQRLDQEPPRAAQLPQVPGARHHQQGQHGRPGALLPINVVHTRTTSTQPLHTNHTTQISHTDFRDGSEIHIIETHKFDKAGRVLPPDGGAVLVFAWSHIPTLVKKAHIAFRLETTAFEGEFTDKGASVQARPGCEVGFLEKTKKSDYVKYVVVAT